MTAEEVKKHVKVYMLVFGSLLILTVVTVGASYLDVALAPALIIALLIAVVKASLVAMYFMHLLGEKPVIGWTLILAAAFLIAMFALFIASLLDQAQVALLLNVA